MVNSGYAACFNTLPLRNNARFHKPDRYRQPPSALNVARSNTPDRFSSSALWCVMNGFASAPPAMSMSIGVSTLIKPRSSRNFWIPRIISARDENSPRLIVNNQIHIAMPIALLNIAQAVPFFWQRGAAL